MFAVVAFQCSSGPTGQALDPPLPPVNPGMSPRDSFPVPLLDAGGLYGNGSNDAPARHLAVGLAAAASVPDSGALFVPLGMSTTSHIWETWWPVANTVANLFHEPRNTACGGCSVDEWDWDLNDEGWPSALEKLDRGGLTGADVDVVWILLVKGNAGNPTSPTLQDLEQVLHQLNIHYPNAKQVFLSSYPYGGFHANGSKEPGLWSSGLVVRQFIQAHLGETDPWIGWGPYLWANGPEPRSDGLTWVREDYRPDGIHLSEQGLAKAAGVLDAWFEASPLTSWYR